MTESENIKKEIEERRNKRKAALRERTFIMGATSITDENDSFKEEIDPVKWASKFFESKNFTRQRFREDKEEKSNDTKRILTALEKAYETIKNIVIDSTEQVTKAKGQEDLKILAKMMDRYKEEFM